jgi:hypothetical protein
MMHPTTFAKVSFVFGTPLPNHPTRIQCCQSINLPLQYVVTSGDVIIEWGRNNQNVELLCLIDDKIQSSLYCYHAINSIWYAITNIIHRCSASYCISTNFRVWPSDFGTFIAYCLRLRPFASALTTVAQFD